MKFFGRGRAPRKSLEAAPPRAPRPDSAPRAADGGREVSYAYTQDLVVLSDAAGRTARAIRDTSLEIMAQHVSRGHRSLALCGVGRGEGVSFLCANIAAAMALDGVSTLLIDADLAHPSLENFVRPSKATPGLQEYLLTDSMSREDIIHRDVAPSLSLIYSGGSPAHSASELVGRARFGDLVRACMREFQIVIIDTPPASLSADTLHIATVAHYAMIVARAGVTHVDGVEVLTKGLADDGVEVVGSILNAV